MATTRRLDSDDVRRVVVAFTGQEPTVWPPQHLDLAQAFAIALHCRPEFRSARAALASRRAAHSAAGSWPNPAFSVGPGIVTNAAAGEASWLLTTGIGLPLDLGGRRRADVEAAASEVAAAQIDVARVDQSIRADVAACAFVVAAAQRDAELREQAAQLARRVHQLAEARVAVGALDATTEASARASAMRAQSEFAVAVGESRRAHRELERSLGLAAGALAGIDVAVPEPPLPPEIGDHGAWHEAIATSNLDIGGSMCAYARAEAELRRACAAQWPDLDLGPGFEYDQGLHKLKLDIGFSLPLCHGNGAEIARATAARTAAAAFVEATVAKALADGDRALRTFELRRQEQAAAVEMAKATAAVVVQAEARVAAGADDEGSRIAALLAAIVAETVAVQARREVSMAWLAAELALRRSLGDGLLAWTALAPEEEQ